MNIKEIANKLNDCANHRCTNCKYLYVEYTELCQSYLIKDMGRECAMIDDSELDDGR